MTHKNVVLLAFAVAVLVGAFTWWRAPYASRLTLSVPSNPGDLVFSPDGRLLGVPFRLRDNTKKSGVVVSEWQDIATAKYGFRVFEIAKGSILSDIAPVACESVGFTRDNQKLVGFSWGIVSIWDTASGKLTQEYQTGGRCMVPCLSSGRFLIVHRREWGDAVVFDLFSTAKISEFHAGAGYDFYLPLRHGGLVTSMLYSNLTSRSKIWNVSSGELLGECTWPSDGTGYLFSPSSKTVIRINKSYESLDMKTGRRCTFAADVNGAAALSPDGRYLTVSSPVQAEGIIGAMLTYFGLSKKRLATNIFETATGTHLGAFTTGNPTPQGFVTRCHFSPDSTTLAVAYDNEVRVYDFPLRTAWLRILGYGLLTAGLTGLLAAMSRLRRGLRGRGP